MKDPITVQIDKSEIEKTVSIQEVVSASESYLKITNKSEYEKAQEFLKVIKSKSKELEESRKSITKPLDESKKQVMELYKPYLTELENMEKKVKSAILKYVEEEERRVREEQERIRREMEKEAEKQKKKIEAKIEKAIEKGNIGKAEEEKQKLDVLATTPLIVPNLSADINNKSVSFRERWYAEVVDFKSLPDEYKIPNQQLLDKVAQSTKGAIKIDGVIFKSEKIVVSR